MTMPIFCSLCDGLRDSTPLAAQKRLKPLGVSCETLLISTGALIALWIGYLGYKWCTADPNAVQTIYTPPHPSTYDIQNLELHAEKIEKLKKNPEVMGITFADRKGSLCPIYIKHTEPEDSKILFTAHDLATDTQLGFAITLPFLDSNEYLKDYWLMMPPQYQGYGSSQDEVSKVLLEQVTNTSDYKNIGVILNKAIHQKFEKKCQGRILIDAVRETHPYHYKMGFRSLDPEKNRLYSQYAKERQIPNLDLGSIPMYLPDRARELWLKEIREFPIQFYS
jgi:hypothetical protein